MPSYVITGASRGIGLEFVRQLSQDQNNIVFGLCRNPQRATKLLDLQKGSSNIHVIKADLDDVRSLEAAATEVAKVTGGSLDYLINNGAYTAVEHASLNITQFPDAKSLEDDLIAAFRTNVVGVAHTINAFLPLLRKSAVKKVITLSTGLAATDVILGSDFNINPQYPVSKAAVNMLVAQYAVSLRDEGFTFLAISPGVVNTAEKPPTPEEIEGFKAMVKQFQKYAPDWDGVPLTPETSVTLMRDVIAKAGPKDTGAFVSHFGNQKWL
ncbi:short-chain dehydrogenases/reductase [Lentinus tigrinus ALCF2SS1-7]|uniref:Short-chain dehydrogenases/reductase n=1 Tax=Lentinus tigrinus ALCF2SS1-6 TaxID=1328759 RepID=A0A5C2SAB6_9APHY|nr:short-chain dehydrogenases/reductase [Lentinus tigrinus ALCF2SS1-6]RPD72936.1 short-chain dehydrogenases/reductase [Lentinus tigrinus ALCF2SS1-7]